MPSLVCIEIICIERHVGGAHHCNAEEMKKGRRKILNSTMKHLEYGSKKAAS